MSTALHSCGPSTTNRHRRPSRAEVDSRREELRAIVEENQPVTVRGAMYLCYTRGLCGKDDKGYRRVQYDVKVMRRAGQVPYAHIVDHTRWMRKPRTHDSLEAALEETAETYRKALWTRANSYAETWCEKNALAGTILPVTAAYDVPLMVTVGHSSDTFAESAGQVIEAEDRPCFIYYLGDWDPPGVCASVKLEEKLRAFAPTADIHFERVGVTEQQIREWQLPTQPTPKKSAQHYRRFWPGGDSCQLDAVPPHQLRGLLRERIERHLPVAELDALGRIEEAERETFRRFLDSWRTNGGAS